jgi:lipoyl-dependent peroxiredoxin subunit D
MSWVNTVKEFVPDYAKDIRLNLDAVINRSTLEQVEAEGCALAAAVASGNKALHQIIAGGIKDEKERVAAQSAGAIMSMTNAWYPYVEMSGDESLKGLPAQLRMNVIGSSGGTTKGRFEAYSLAASIVGRCHFCVRAHYDGLKKEGYTVEQLRDIGRIAATINAVSKVV